MDYLRIRRETIRELCFELADRYLKGPFGKQWFSGKATFGPSRDTNACHPVSVGDLRVGDHYGQDQIRIRIPGPDSGKG